MTYVDGFIAAVPNDNKQAYIDHARKAAVIFKEHGAQKLVDTWGDDVPDGKQTDFKKAVQAKADETVVFSWVIWADKAARDAGWEKIMKDERMHALELPFDGKRMIYGGFAPIMEA